MNGVLDDDKSFIGYSVNGGPFIAYPYVKLKPSVPEDFSALKLF